MVIPPQAPAIEVAEAVVPPAEVNYFCSDTIRSDDSSRSGEPDEYDPETGLDDDSFVVNDM